MKQLLNALLLKYFIQEPRHALGFLYKLNLDIWIYTIPLFLFYNRHSIIKFIRLRLKGARPKVIFWAVESDGRFDRVHALSQKDEGVVFFKFHNHLVGVEYFIFASYVKIPIGFYEDARQKYISPNNLQNRLNYRKYLRSVFGAFEIFLGRIDVFMCGSNNDRYVVELIYVFQERGGVCIIPEREGTGTDYTYQAEARCFKESNSIQANYIFTANQKHKKMFDYAKMESVKEIKVLGELDTDWWFHWDKKFNRIEYERWNKFSKKILFLTFGDRNYIEPFLYPDNPELTWRPLMLDCENVLLDYLKKNPDTLVFYKMGHLEDNNAIFLERCKEEGIDNIVALNRTFPCNELMLYSDLIIGFQTTAMFEAMFTDKPIFFLNWHIPKILDPDYQLLPITRYNGCKSVNSKDDFLRLLDDFTQSEAKNFKPDAIELQNRQKTREIMFFKADGRTSERFYSEIKRVISIKQP